VNGSSSPEQWHPEPNTTTITKTFDIADLLNREAERISNTVCDWTKEGFVLWNWWDDPVDLETDEVRQLGMMTFVKRAKTQKP
jgi:hypothetical protein